MDWSARMAAVRERGPRRPLLRHVLLCLALYDTSEDPWVFGGRLEQETGYSDRAIREALRELVLLGWIEPQTPANGEDWRQVSRNQHRGGPWQPEARPRVHGHLGGCLPGGTGCRTRYRILYPEHPGAERPRGRKVGKGERGATRGNGAPLTPGGDTPLPTPTRGNGAPTRGNGAPNKGEPRSPDWVSEREEERSGGAAPPSPQAVVAPQRASAPGDPLCRGLPLAADAAQCPQGGLPGAGAPEGSGAGAPEGRQATGGVVRQRWSTMLADVITATGDDIGVKLWLRSAKVYPIEIDQAGALHVRVPTPHWAVNCARFAAPLAEAAARLGFPCSSTHFHPAAADAAA